ncbi:MAG: hypothetical protein HY340_02795 [Candidatus Kerfeldbacteria bacterium]|nr:hypothetical protein [Candidatus Kerfeldbacteria bacterium]
MKPFTPQLSKLPKRTVITITAVGSPKAVFTKTLPSLYGTAYGTKFKVFRARGKKMEIGHLVSAYPKGLTVAMNKLVGTNHPVPPVCSTGSVRALHHGILQTVVWIIRKAAS